MCSRNLTYDGKIYCWNGSWPDLKRFVANKLNMQGNWSSPGGYAKLFCSVEGELSIKLAGEKSQSHRLVIQADNSDHYLQHLIKSETNTEENEALDSTIINLRNDQEVLSAVQTTHGCACGSVLEVIEVVVSLSKVIL